jgi:DNA-binding CsgD family transcriptional regulator
MRRPKPEEELEEGISLYFDGIPVAQLLGTRRPEVGECLLAFSMLASLRAPARLEFRTVLRRRLRWSKLSLRTMSSVASSSGELIGRILWVGENCFCLDTHGGYIWLSLHAVSFIEHGRVHLTCEAGGLAAFAVPPPVLAPLPLRTLGMRRAQRPVDKLTDRELDVLLLITEGLSKEEVAERLGVTRRTIATYVSTILHKLRTDQAENSPWSGSKAKRGRGR